VWIRTQSFRSKHARYQLSHISPYHTGCHKLQKTSSEQFSCLQHAAKTRRKKVFKALTLNSRVYRLKLTLSPALMSGTSEIISMVPLVILVGMERAWKKEVFSGPMPVFWAGTVTSSGARAPALAGAFTLLASSRSLHNDTTHVRQLNQ
jgi:hypothetical protein